MQLRIFNLYILFTLVWLLPVSAQDAGTTPDAFDVSLTGAATYSVPLAVPPGIRDVIPKVSIDFNSQAGNGLVGYGWNVGGLSTITRVGSTLYHDGEIDAVDFDTKDKFALDGQRLLLKSGTYGKNGSIYQTENYSNLKIRAIGTSTFGAAYGPNYFIVHYPDGSRGFYGRSTARGRLEWALDRWQDPQGNFIRYTYSKTNDLLRIANIYYGSRSGTASPNRIQFTYANRARREQSHLGGIEFKRTKILNRIRVYAGAAIYRQYTIDHNTTTLGYQTVEKIQESNGVGGMFTPITFEYGETGNGFNSVEVPTATISYEIDSVNTRTLTGDFDGDGRMDVSFYDIRDRNKFHIYQNLYDGAAPDTGREYRRGRIDHIFTRTALDSDNKLMSKQAITLVSDSYFSGVTSEVRFRTHELGDNGSLVSHSTKTWNAPVYRAERLCDDNFRLRTSKRFITGDFNGDAITDVIALTGPYTETFCNPRDCDDDDPDDPPQPIAILDGPTNAAECCECTDYVRNRSQSYFIDLDRRKTTGFSSYSGLIQRPIAYDDPIFAADFDGDGVSEMIHISSGRVEVYGLGDDKILRLVYSLEDDKIDKQKPFLPGDYNGDGKIDFAFPEQVFTSNWRFFLSTGTEFTATSSDIGLEFRPTEFTTVLVNEFKYIPQDFNGDGKTDILRHFIATPADGFNNRYQEQFKLYSNIDMNGDVPVFEQTVDASYFDTNQKKFGIPLFLDLNSANPNLEYAYISRQKITAWEFEKNHQGDTRLNKIVNNGVEMSLTYDCLVGVPFEIDQEETYFYDVSEIYPYTNVNVLPSYELVTNIERKGSGIVQKQDFRYKGAVSHAKGLGFLGFKQLFRTNWYGDDVTLLWNVSTYDPQLRGAPIQQWSANFFGNTPFNYIAKTDYVYLTEELPNKVFVNIPETITVDDALNGFMTTQTFQYNANYDPTRTSTSSPGGGTVTNFAYFNNLNSNNQNYHVGRPKSKKVTSTVGSNSFYDEQVYTYQNNLVKTIKRKGQGTEWVTETQVRDSFGNMLNKTLSAPGLSARAETFVYDSSGRYLVSSQDIEGLVTTFDYELSTGNLVSTTDPYGRTSNYTHDGWNRPITETNYLGKITMISYSNTLDGGFEQLTDYDQGADKRETYNALGWMTETRTLSLNGKWIVALYKYDTAGRKIRVYEPYFSNASGNQYTSTAYDEYGRPVSVILYTGEVQSMSYNGLQVTVDDGTKITVTTSDSLGNIIETSDPGGTVQYTYFGNGVMETADYGGQVVRTEIDPWGRKTKLIDPSAGTYTYTYNLFGELIEETTPKGTTTYALDAVGKLSQKIIQGDETDMVLNYVYDGTDKLLRTIDANDNANNRSYTYNYDFDNFKRPISVIELNPFARFETRMTYDGYGRPWRETYKSRNLADGTEADITVRNVYEAASGMLKEIRNNAPNTRLWRLNAHDARGQITRTVLGNGFKQNRNFDTYGLPKTIRDVKGSGSTQLRALRMNYNFDAERGTLKNRRNIDLNWTENFQYDELDRLTTIAGAVQKSQTYDNRGRITANSTIGTYNYDSPKIYQLASLDLNEDGGNYFQDRERREIVYNAFKKPTEINQENSGRITLGYSPLMNRSHAWYGGEEEETSERRFEKHYSAISPVEIIMDKQSGETKIMTYVGGNEYSASIVHIKTKNSTVNGYHYLHRDYLGSVLAITDSSSSIVEQTQFGAWGVVDRHMENGTETEFGQDSLLGRGYTGHEHFASVSLIHMNGRMYDAGLGRFLSPDNYVQDPYNTQNFDRYGYVLNNPLVYSDPSGEFAWAAVAVGALIGGLTRAATPGSNFGNILTGTLIGAASGLVGAGVSNLAAGGGFFTNAALNVSGFAGGLSSGFAGGFAGAFTASTLTSLTNGDNFWGAFVYGVRDGYIGGAIGGLLGGMRSGIKSLNDGKGFWGNKGPANVGNTGMETSNASTIKKAIVLIEEPDLNFTDWTGTAPGPDGNTVFRTGRASVTYTYKVTEKVFDLETTLRVNGAEWGRGLQKGGDYLTYTGYGLTLTGVGAEAGVPMAATGNLMGFTGSLLESTATANWEQGGTAVGGFIIKKSAGQLLNRIPGGKLTRQILKQNANLKINLITKHINSN